MRRLVVVFIAALLVTSAVQPAVAQEDDYWDGLVTEDGDIVTRILEGIGNLLGDLARTQDKYLGDEGADAATYVADIQSTFNESNATIGAYASERLPADTGHDVARIYVHDEDGGNETLYLVSDVENESWTNARLVDQASFEDLNRSVDFWVSMDWFVSKHAADELETFVDDYADENRNLSRSYQLRKISKYGSGIKSDLWGDDSPAFSE